MKEVTHSHTLSVQLLHYMLPDCKLEVTIANLGKSYQTEHVHDASCEGRGSHRSNIAGLFEFLPIFQSLCSFSLNGEPIFRNCQVTVLWFVDVSLLVALFLKIGMVRVMHM